MADPVLVPPTPTINQSDTPEQIAATVKNVQAIFDKVSPKIRGTPTPETEPKTRTAASTLPEQAKEPTRTPEQPIEKAPERPEARTIPSFLEKALDVPQVKAETPAHEEEWPEELPAFKSTDEAKQRYKTWRDKYNSLKGELKAASSRPSADPQLQEKLTFLENKNKDMEAQLSRFNVEMHSEFQNRILRPMHESWNEASRIVKESGGDPADLAKALALSGKAQYEALDAIFEGMPESAKIEANEAVRSYRRLDDQRRRALADAPRAAEALRKSDLQRQYQAINKQKEEMQAMWEAAGAKLRDEAKVEVMQRSSDPADRDWNDAIDADEETSRRLFLENTDMEKVAMACRLAPLVDRYRRLWLVERQARLKSDGILKDKFGSEPSLSESGGNTKIGRAHVSEDLKKPFSEVFLREFHKQRSQGVQ